jgi:hypothetical protein
MRSKIHSLLLGAALAFAAPLAIGLPATAEATTVAKLTLEQFTDASTYIVRGTVTEIWTEEDADGTVWTRARVSVTRAYKGPDSPKEIVVDTLGFTDGVQLPQMFGAARFSEGEEVFVFLDEFRPGRYTPVAANTGKYTIRRAPGDDRHYAATVSIPERERFDARFLPHPAPERRLYVEDLEQRVQARLETGWDGGPIPGLSKDHLRVINQPERRIR